MSPIDPKFTLALANEHLYSVPYKQVDTRWLRLYIQASVAHARSLEAEEAIRVLDRAIIVAGPSVEIFDLIRQKQAHLSLPALSWAGSSRITGEVGRGGGVSSELVAAKQRIPRYEDGVSRRDAGAKRPYVTRTGIDWPALHKWHDANYLLSVAGPCRHVPVEVGRSYDEDGWTQKIVPFVDFLRRAWGGQNLSGGRRQGAEARTGEAGKAEPAEAEGTSGPPMYLAQYDLLRQIPALQRDIAMPDQVWESEHGVEPMINVWMGSGGGEVVSPAHTVRPCLRSILFNPGAKQREKHWTAADRVQDPWNNCYVQVVGHKRVWLAPPAAKI